MPPGERPRYVKVCITPAIMALPGRVFQVCCALAARCSPEKPTCWPTYERIAADMGWNPAMVRKCVNKAAALGALTKQRRNSFIRRENVYDLSGFWGMAGMLPSPTAPTGVTRDKQAQLHQRGSLPSAPTGVTPKCTNGGRSTEVLPSEEAHRKSPSQSDGTDSSASASHVGKRPRQDPTVESWIAKLVDRGMTDADACEGLAAMQANGLSEEDAGTAFWDWDAAFDRLHVRYPGKAWVAFAKTQRPDHGRGRRRDGTGTLTGDGRVNWPAEAEGGRGRRPPPREPIPYNVDFADGATGAIERGAERAKRDRRPAAAPAGPEEFTETGEVEL